MKDIIYNGVGEENPQGGSRVDAFLYSVIILTSRPIVIIIIKEGEIEIFITSFYLIINALSSSKGWRRKSMLNVIKKVWVDRERLELELWYAEFCC